MKDARVNNLGGLLTRTARLFPSHHAVIAEGKSWTWKEVDQRVPVSYTHLTLPTILRV